MKMLENYEMYMPTSSGLREIGVSPNTADLNIKLYLAYLDRDVGSQFSDLTPEEAEAVAALLMLSAQKQKSRRVP